MIYPFILLYVLKRKETSHFLVHISLCLREWRPNTAPTHIQCAIFKHSCTIVGGFGQVQLLIRGLGYTSDACLFACLCLLDANMKKVMHL